MAAVYIVTLHYYESRQLHLLISVSYDSLFGLLKLFHTITKL